MRCAEKCRSFFKIRLLLLIRGIVDENNITSVSLNNLSESVTAMYPLLEPSLDSINEQLDSISSVDELTLDSESRYTGLILQQAIKNALQKAKS